jgi:hypothetical protein
LKKVSAEAAAQERQRRQERAAWERGQKEAEAARVAAAFAATADARAKDAAMLNKERARLARVHEMTTAARHAQVDQEVAQDERAFFQRYYQMLQKEFEFLPPALQLKEAARVARGALRISEGRKDSGRVRETDAAVYAFKEAIALYRASDVEFATPAERQRLRARIAELEAMLEDAESQAAYLRNNKLGGGSTRRSSLPIRKAGHSSFSGTTRYTRRRRA